MKTNMMMDLTTPSDYCITHSQSKRFHESNMHRNYDRHIAVVVVFTVTLTNY
jgi:hypothetical protein